EQFGRALRVELKPHGASASVAYFGFIDTRMVQDAVEDPVVERMLQTLPAFARKRLAPSAAGQAIVTGIERRSPRIVAPGWWRAFSALRGILNPLFDLRAERDPDIQAAVREADRAERPERAPAPPGV
ncbi:MAG: short-chain dehydrogenase/reductase, partial [Solirubrobacteraceae bacterium]